MIDTDYQTFSEAWADAHEIMPGGKALSAGAMTLCFDALSRYPIDVVLLAIKRHIAVGRFAPIPKDIIDILETGNRHVGADEAWAIVLESFDEFETVAMTKEIAEARLVALPIWQEGDKVGARMAFKSAYDRIIITAPAPEWFVSEGFDKSKRELAVKKFVQLGRISRDAAAKYLPAPMDGGPIGKLIAGKVTEMPANNENLRKHWHELGRALRDGQARLEERERLIREQRRLAFEAKRQEALDAVQKKMEQV